ncbi:hypothetical protein SMICM17S_10706 [Streptomyces microflavus]
MWWCPSAKRPGRPATGWSPTATASAWRWRPTGAGSPPCWCAPESGAEDRERVGGSAGHAEDRADGEVQRWFCDTQLPTIEDAAREHGVDLARTSALPPGVRTYAVAPDGSWPDNGLAHDRAPDGGPGHR